MASPTRQVKPTRVCGQRNPTLGSAAATAAHPRTPRLITILFSLVALVLNLYKWAVILAAVMSNLIAFGVVDTRNRLVWTISDFLYRITEPALRVIRRYLPSFGGIDLSPLVLLLLVWLAQSLLGRLEYAVLTGNLQALWL